MFNTYMGMLVWPMIALGWVVNLMQRGTASLGRISQILRERPTIAAPATPVPARTACAAKSNFATSASTTRRIRALDGIDLRIRAGATVAIVGHTGCGKSTLVAPDSAALPTRPRARVLLDGSRPARACHRPNCGATSASCPQETFLFSATLAENIAFGVRERDGRADPPGGRTGRAGAGYRGVPERLPDLVGERGITLSGGQKQRTAIARALLRNPRILILDDALSSVDTLTEERILSGLAGIMRGRTIILISHRVSTVRQADRIVVLEHGRIVEQGTHAELVVDGGYYADLYQKQLLEEELEAI